MNPHFFICFGFLGVGGGDVPLRNHWRYIKT